MAANSPYPCASRILFSVIVTSSFLVGCTSAGNSYDVNGSPEQNVISPREDLLSVCTSSAENIVCCNDLGWYALYVSRLVEEISAQVVIINLGNDTVVNSTVGEILANLTAQGAGSNVLELVSVVVSYGDDVVVQLNGLEVLGLLDNSVTAEDILSQIEWTGTIGGPEILNITVSVNLAGAPIQTIAVGDLIGEGDPAAAVVFIWSVIQNGPVIDVSAGQVTINNYTLAEVAEIFGITGQVGPLIIDPSLFPQPSIDIPNIGNLTIPPDWIIQMLDASGIKSLPSGVLRGNSITIGNFRQCLNTNAEEPNSELFPIGNIELPLTPTFFGGQYCWAVIDQTTVQRGLPIPAGFLPLPGAARGGICLPDTCSQETLNRILNVAINDPALNETIAQLGLQSFESCSSNQTKSLSTVEVITILVLVVFFIALLIGTTMDYMQTSKNPGGKSKGPTNPLMQCILAFSIIKNIDVIMDTGSRKKGSRLKPDDVIACLFGIRFFSTAWVILGHTFTNASWIAFETDPLGFVSIFQRWTYQPITNGWPVVDTFFFMGGLLVTYLMLKNLHRHGLSWGFIPKLYAHRYLRLTPLYGLVLLVSYALVMRIGSGPYWDRQYPTYFQPCETKWWHSLLYLTTILSPSPDCVPHGWYLSSDMLYFLATPFLVIPMYLSGAFATVYTFLVLGASFGITAAVHLAHDTPGAVPWSILGAGGLGEFFDEVYYRPHTRFGVYAVGILTGYWLFRTRNKRVKLSGGVVLLGWLSAFGTGLAVIFGMYEGDTPIPKDTLLAYGVLHRQAWGLALAWLVFACVHGYGGFINTILSWSLFRPLGRMAYATYLVHLYVVNWKVYQAKTQVRFDTGMQIYNFIGNLIISYALGFIAAVAIEFPLGTICNILLETLSTKLSKLLGHGRNDLCEDFYTWKRNYIPVPKLIISEAT